MPRHDPQKTEDDLLRLAESRFKSTVDSPESNLREEVTNWPSKGQGEITSTQTPQNPNVSIVASHGKRMICILRSFLLDYDKLKLEPVGDCIVDFYKNIHSVSNRDFLKGDKWYKKSPCKEPDFDKTFPNFLTEKESLNSESSNMKCFPQFINGAALNIEMNYISAENITLTIELLHPIEPLPEDEDLKKKLVFRTLSPDIHTEVNVYKAFTYTVPFQTLNFRATSECYLIKNVLKSVGDKYNVIIVRHGQGYHNIESFKNTSKMLYDTSFTADTRLTPKGIVDANIGANSIQSFFSDSLKDIKYFSSDLYRAKETAVLIAKNFGNTDVKVTQLPIIHEISNCEKQDKIVTSSKPDMNFPGDHNNPDKVYCSNLGHCSDNKINVTIDYTTFFKKVTLYNLLFKNQYVGRGQFSRFFGNRSSRFAFKDTSFLFQPFEIIELLLAFTLMDMTDNPYFSVNGKDEYNSKIGPGMKLTNGGLPPEDVLIRLPGFRTGNQNKAYNYITSMFGRTTRIFGRYGGNRKTLKKRRKKVSNKRRTNKKRLTNKRKTNKRRTYKKRRTIRQRK